jgi:hypothetical protein
MVRSLVTVLILTAVPVPEDDTKKAAELKWAKEVATDFLNAGMQTNYASAEALVAPDFKKVLSDGQTSVTYLLSRAASGGGGQESWTIASEEIAPDKDEAFFRGTFKAKKSEAEFSLRVAKEKEGGKWRVCFFTAGAYKEPEKPRK